MSSTSPIAPRAHMPNPALKPFEFLLGEWRTTGTHPQMPGKSLPGRTSFAWHEGGAFLIMRNAVAEKGFPDGVAIIGSDGSGAFAMSYFDERGVSRLFQVTVGDGTVSWRRDDPEFAQSVTLTAEDSGDRLVSKGRMSRDGGPWTDDLSQVFTRTHG